MSNQRSLRLLSMVLSLLGTLPVVAQLPLPKAYPNRRGPDAFHNADGSTRYSFELGGGGVLPIGGTGRSMTGGGSVAAAAGVNLNKHVALQGRGEYDQTGVPRTVLLLVNQPKGQVRAGSVTANVILRYVATDHFGAYVTGGGGYYRRVTRFLTPVINGTNRSDQLTGLYTLNTYGGDAGLGFEWKPSVFSNMKIFAEARLNYLCGQTPTTTAGGYTLNSHNAQFVPALIGVRW